MKGKNLRFYLTEGITKKKTFCNQEIQEKKMALDPDFSIISCNIFVVAFVIN